MTSLEKKIAAIEDEHAAETEAAHLATHDKQRAIRSFMLLGGIRAVNRVAENMNSQVMQALINFQEEGLYGELGFARFADFLDQSEFSPMSKTEFYRRKQLFEAEGPEVYDVFTAAKISPALRKLLTAGGVDVTVEGDEVVIGTERVPASDNKAVKELVLTVADVIREREAEITKLQATVEKQKDRLRQGESDYEQLQRNFDAYRENSPYANAVMAVVGAVGRLVREIAELPEDQRAKFAEADMATFGDQWFRLCDAYGVPSSRYERFAANGGGDAAGTKATIMDRALEMISHEGMDDLDDLT